MTSTETKLPQVSIVIPAYNASETIAQTLESVLSQTHPGWEAIVVDDGSVDGTAEIVKTFIESDSRIRLLQQAQAGEAGARNAGLAHVRYDWLLFLDADDWISPVHLQTMLNEIVLNPELSAVHCRSARVAGDGTLILEKFQPPGGDLFAILARRAAFPGNACIVRRSLVESVGKFDVSFVKSPDWDLWQRIARTGARFGSVPEVLAFYRMRSNAASLDAHQMLKDGLRVLKQGHAPDPRVPNPHPDHAQGLPPDQIHTQQYYLLSWCAGLLIGTGQDARPLMQMVDETPFPELYPDAVAQCIFESAPLPACQPPESAEHLFFKTLQHVDEFLAVLEEKSRAPDLKHRAGMILRKMILRHSPNWKMFLEEYDKSIQGFNEKNELLEADLRSSKRALEERERIIVEHEEVLREKQTLVENLRQDIQAKEKQNAELLQFVEQKERENLQLRENLNESDALVAQLEASKQSQQKQIETVEGERDNWSRTAHLWKSRYKKLRMNFFVRLGLKLRMMKNPMAEGKMSDRNN